MHEAPANFSMWKRIYLLGWRYPGRFLLMLGLVISFGGLMGYMVYVFDQVLGFLSQDQNAIDKLSPTEIQDLCASMRNISYQLFAISPIAAAVAYFAFMQGQWIANQCMVEIRRSFIGHLIDLDLGFHSELARGDLFTRMSGDMERLQSLLAQMYGKVQQHPFELIAYTVILLYLNWVMCVILFCGILPVLLLLGKAFKRTYKRSKKAQQKMANTLVTFEQITSGIRVIKAMGSQQVEIDRFDADNVELFNAKLRVAHSRASADASSNFMAFALMAATILLGTYGMESGFIEPKDILIFLLVTGRLTTLARTSQRALGQILELSASAIRILGILDRPSSIKDCESPANCPATPTDTIRFNKVSFRYIEDSDNVLDEIEFEIPIGKSVAFVGESGAGKSTMLDLIPRFYDVNAGTITLDGTDIRNFKRDDYSKLFSIVQQDSFLFNDTVFNNIAYGDPNADKEAVITAAKQAHVHQNILDLEGGLGYDSIVGDRGDRLSGGQRQRVAIARALLRNAPILLLDEPTSALDAESERHVQEALKVLMKNRTSIIVAHRLSTIQDADLIIVVDKQTGKVKEQGSHQELLQLDGAYAELVRIQTLKEVES